MPLPDEPTVLEGGCNCRAIRYRVSIPAKAERPFYLAGGADSTPPVRAPVVCTDHCNDCRAATGSILPCWLLAPMEMVTVSLVSADAAAAAAPAAAGKLDGTAVERGAWRAARELFAASSADPTTTLAFFASSPCRRRSFCARCGTMLAYNVFPKPPKWTRPEYLDIVLGTVDREYLERHDLRPERQLWWDRGIGWVQEFAKHGLSVPCHPRARTDEIVVPLE